MMHFEHALRNSEIFRELPSESIGQIVAQCSPQEARRGETLIQQGAQGDCLYVVVAGRLRFFVNTDQLPDTLVGELGPGETVGEMALLTGEPRSATVIAARDSLLLKMTQKAFEELVAQHPSVVLPIVRAVLKRQQRLRGLRAHCRPSTIAVLPLAAESPSERFSEQLVRALAAFAEVVPVTFADARTTFGAELLEQMSAQTSHELAVWLSHREACDRLVVLFADAQSTSWNRWCVRQADSVLAIGSVGPATDARQRFDSLLDWSDPLAPRVEYVGIAAPSDRSQPTLAAERELRRVVRRHLVALDCAEDFARLGRAIVGQAVGVVLSGGGARGFAHIGALRALEEAQLPIDVIGGCSMGALIAAQVARGWKWDEIRSNCREMWITSGSAFDYTIPLVSLLAGRRGEQRLRRILGDVTIEELKIPYFCVTADITNAKLATHTTGPLWKAVMASASLPGILPPRVFEGDLHCDGGVLDNLPVSSMRHMTRGPVLAIDVGLPRRLAVGQEVDAIPAGGSLLLRKINPWADELPVPNIFSILGTSALLASIGRTEEVKRVSDFYVHLPVDNFAMFAFDRIDELIALGYEAMSANIETWSRIVRQIPVPRA